LTSRTHEAKVDVVLRPLAIALALQLLALSVLHAFAPCHEVEDDHDGCAHSQVTVDDDAATRDAVHAHVESPDHDACHCPCHARVLTVRIPPASPLERTARRTPERPPVSPRWRAESPPTPPPQA